MLAPPLAPRRRSAPILVVAAIAVVLALAPPAQSETALDGWMSLDRLAAGPELLAACDDLDPTACLLPFPNDVWTRPDATTDTGLRVDIPTLATPTNTAGKPIDTTEWNRNDGFSPGSLILTVVPNVDLSRHPVLPR